MTARFVRRSLRATTTFVSALVMLALVPAARADERILSFHSDIDILGNGSMTVTETIRVRAEGDSIRRGIFRDFPTDYTDRLGNRYRVAFDVTAVARDERPEPYFTERRGNGVRVYIGDANVFLDPGIYEYRLSYATDYQLGFFDAFDELYWNVTGNGWDFPIDAASARVTLPVTVDRATLSIEGYTGRTGSSETAISAAIVNGSTATIAATRALGPREGLTLALRFPKGIVTEPSAADRIARLLAANLGLLIALGAIMAVAIYLFLAWHRYGRDPEPGPIFPHYEPPPEISPAAARHVTRMGYDNRAFTAAILSLAVKGYLSIEDDDGDYLLRATNDGTAALSAGESALLARLFADTDTLALEKANHRPLQRARAAHRRALKREHQPVYFATNTMLVVPSIVIIAGAAVAIVILEAMSIAAIAILVAALLLVPVFAYLLKAPTRIGRRLLDKLDGFRLYLDVAEKDELALRNPPTKTPELFEAYLPYALALGVEQHWAEKFDAVFAQLEASGRQAYAPRWYHGNAGLHGFARNAGSMTAAMTGALNAAIASASTPPGSSSGGGGGGVSGGGGGGGGGGGW